MQVVKTVAVAFIVSLLVSVGTLYYYHKHYAPKIVAINLNNYIQKQERAFVTGQITKQQLQERLKEVVDYIKKQPKNTIILTGNCVLRGKMVNLSSK